MTHYIKGDHNVICDRTGFKVKASECRMEWNGLFVMSSVWEERQPQDFIKVPADIQTVAIPRPDTTPTFVTTNQVQPGDL